MLKFVLSFAFAISLACFARAADAGPTFADIYGRWSLVEINGEPAIQPLPLTLTPDGAAISMADACNHLSYRFKRAGERIEFIWTEALMTTSACRSPLPPQLATFSRILRQRVNASIAEDGSLIVTASDGQTMRLERRTP